MIEKCEHENGHLAREIASLEIDFFVLSRAFNKLTMHKQKILSRKLPFGIEILDLGQSPRCKLNYSC
jgi:hypothetical protein